jgi:arylsulfatase A-like enzyme
MNQDSKPRSKERTAARIILTPILSWAAGGFIFGLVEGWIGMVIYHYGLQNIGDLALGPVIYTLIGILGGGILGVMDCLLAAASKTEKGKTICSGAFYMAANISLIAFIWSAVWFRDIFAADLAVLEPVVNYSFKMNLIFVFCVLGYIIYHFLKTRKNEQRLMISFAGLSFSLYIFVGIEMYLNSLFLPEFLTPANIIYLLLNLGGSLVLGWLIYYILSLLMKLNWWYRSGVTAALILIITVTVGVVSEIRHPNQGNQGPARKISITNRNNVLHRKKPNILFLTLDALRADHLSCYGYDKIQTPVIDRLADNGVLFSRTIAQAPWTLPSLASMFTSLYPTVHGAKKLEFASLRVGGKKLSKVNDNVIWLSEILKHIGYSTRAFVNNQLISAKFGFDRGFDSYYNLAHQQSGTFLWSYIIADENSTGQNATVMLTQKVLAWLESTAEQPFFLWIHYLDPHLPYERYKTYNLKPEYNGKLKDDEFVRRLEVKSIRSGRYNLKSADKDYLKSVYDEEILLVDENIGLILNKLEKLNLLDDTLVIFTSDHGEEFWEHNNYEHGHSLYQEVVHIPLILQLPGVLPRGLRITRQVRAIDIMPTILEVLGIEHNLNIQGRSLLSLIRGEEAEDRIAFSENLVSFEERKSIRDGKYNFIYFPYSDKKELYDLENDPRELRNIIDEQPDVGLKLQGRLLDWLRDCRNMANALGTDKHSEPVELDMGTKERLKALGYL